ncbi:acetyltransferase (GNAT) family protein [Alteromonadaceae bacterium 2753L.S.0a.02]|nr:acetyltransferase (GNAT) family protein [Alteromonadaceae bacterium 2753L.S.0a.02]
MIQLCTTETQFDECYSVLSQLYSDLTQVQFKERISEMSANGYQIVLLRAGNTPVCYCGFITGENFACGRYLYLCELVTIEAYRSRGYGEQMLDWLLHYARDLRIETVHLDSPVTRHQAHKFYMTHGFVQAAYHFELKL